ncbi:hypothetical protein ACGF12_35595 [Kitasatospora sp. NPDC048296]|uniref:hypothetical protein n=1 Tax=Kitasatospora sp. NPDC048296 TaxID=3364048 RepID=UPI003710081C
MRFSRKATSWGQAVPIARSQDEALDSVGVNETCRSSGLCMAKVGRVCHVISMSAWRIGWCWPSLVRGQPGAAAAGGARPP